MSSYPERCFIGIERRTVPSETVEQVEAEMQAILAAAGQDDPDFRAECRTTLVREPFEVAEDASIVTLVQQQAAQATA